MQINITARDFGGTEFLAQPHRLHLGDPQRHLHHRGGHRLP